MRWRLFWTGRTGRRLCRAGWILALLLAIVLIALGYVDKAVDFKTTLGLKESQSFWALAGYLFLITISIATSVYGSLLANQFKKMQEKRLPDVSAYFKNHDLVKLVGLSISMILRDHARSRIVSQQDRHLVETWAQLAPDAWKALIDHPAHKALREDNLTAFVADHARQALSAQSWAHFLRFLNANNTPCADATLNSAAAALESRFGQALREGLKLDWAMGGKAYPAMELSILSELMNAVRELRGRLPGDGAAIVQSAAPHGEQVIAELQALGHAHQKHADFIIRHYRQMESRLTALVTAQHREQMTAHDQTHQELDLLKAQNAKLQTDVAAIRQVLESKPQPAAPDRPPAVDPAIQTAAENIAANPSATLEQRVEAAIVSRSPDALAELERLDQVVNFADFRRHQLRGDYHYFRGEYDAATEAYEKAMSIEPMVFRARNDVVSAHVQSRLGDIAGHCRRAIDVAGETLSSLDPSSVDWATTQNNLGNAWQNMPTGDTADTLRRAIAAYDRALTVFTRAAHPVGWAMTQNNLGSAWRSTPTGDKADNLRRAIAAYDSALTVFTRAAHPVDWATTQNNLGIAWRNMPTGDKADNLRRAIAAYDNALTVFTRAANPVDWAKTQNNLGNAWQNMPTGDTADTLRRAIAAYDSALTVYTRAAHPVDWAKTQNNLGNAWQNMPTGDTADTLRRAIAAYDSALTVFTRAAHPVDWAMTQNNLGIAWRNMPTGDKADTLRRAIAAYDSALTVRTRAAHPVDWAKTQNNLGNAWQNMPTGDKADTLRRAIAAYDSALTVFTRAAHPVDWATTQNNLAVALAEMASVPDQDPVAYLRRAIASGKAALTVRTAESFPREHADTLNNLQIDHRDYEATPGHETVPFDDIPPAA